MDSSFHLVQKLKELPYWNKGFFTYLRDKCLFQLHDFGIECECLSVRFVGKPFVRANRGLYASVWMSSRVFIEYIRKMVIQFCAGGPSIHTYKKMSWLIFLIKSWVFLSVLFQVIIFFYLHSILWVKKHSLIGKEIFKNSPNALLQWFWLHDVSKKSKAFIWHDVN